MIEITFGFRKRYENPLSDNVSKQTFTGLTFAFFLNDKKVILQKPKWTILGNLDLFLKVE